MEINGYFTREGDRYIRQEEDIMFIKIEILEIEDKDNGNMLTKEREYIYDCKRIGFHPLLPISPKDDRLEENDKWMTVIMDVGKQDERTMDLYKENLAIYIMNNEGKTIDKKCW